MAPAKVPAKVRAAASLFYPAPALGLESSMFKRKAQALHGEPSFEALVAAAAVAAAVGDLTYVLATTARPRDMAKTVLTPRRAAAELRARATGGFATGVLFGPERSGLTNPDVVRADAVIQVPLNPVFSSLNLAQAVLLVGYEWYQAGDDTPDVTLAGDGVPAALEKREYFYGRLEAALTESGFLFPENLAPTIKRNLRNLFNRAALTEQEVSTLHGVVKALLKHRPASDGPGPGGA